MQSVSHTATLAYFAEPRDTAAAADKHAQAALDTQTAISRMTSSEGLIMSKPVATSHREPHPKRMAPLHLETAAAPVRLSHLPGHVSPSDQSLTAAVIPPQHVTRPAKRSHPGSAPCRPVKQMLITVGEPVTMGELLGRELTIVRRENKFYRPALQTLSNIPAKQSTVVAS